MLLDAVGNENEDDEEDCCDSSDHSQEIEYTWWFNYTNNTNEWCMGEGVDTFGIPHYSHIFHVCLHSSTCHSTVPHDQTIADYLEDIKDCMPVEHTAREEITSSFLITHGNAHREKLSTNQNHGANTKSHHHAWVLSDVLSFGYLIHCLFLS